MAASLKKYGDTAVFHDGRGGQFNALVLGTRSDSGVTVGPDGEPTITLAYLDPRSAPSGPLRGDLMDSVRVAHDVPFLAGEDLYTFGYNDTTYTYPVAPTETPEDRLAKLEQELAELRAGFGAVAPTTLLAKEDGGTSTGTVPASSPMSIAEQHELPPQKADAIEKVEGKAAAGPVPGATPASGAEPPKAAQPGSQPSGAGVSTSTATAAKVG